MTKEDHIQILDQGNHPTKRASAGPPSVAPKHVESGFSQRRDEEKKVDILEPDEKDLKKQSVRDLVRSRCVA